MQNNTPEPTSPNANAIWEARPSRWLLLNPVLLSFVSIILSLTSALSISNQPIHKPWAYLTQFQSFIFHNPTIGHGIMALTLCIILATFIKYLKILFENYTITPQKLLYATGILSRDIDDTLLFRIIDIGVEMPFLLRILGRGHVIIYSNDPSTESSGIKPSFQTPDGRKGVYLTAVKDPMGVKQLLSNSINIERSKHLTRSTEIL